jgi:hypothetical protein
LDRRRWEYCKIGPPVAPTSACRLQISDMVACSMDASFGGSLTPSPWHTGAVGGRPPHHPTEPFGLRCDNGRIGSSLRHSTARPGRALLSSRPR